MGPARPFGLIAQSDSSVERADASRHEAWPPTLDHDLRRDHTSYASMTPQPDPEALPLEDDVRLNELVHLV